jgi:hypothetical protein
VVGRRPGETRGAYGPGRQSRCAAPRHQWDDARRQAELPREVADDRPRCGTAAEYLRRTGVLGITWPVPAELDDLALERKLFTPPFAMSPAEYLPEKACPWGKVSSVG